MADLQKYLDTALSTVKLEKINDVHQFWDYDINKEIQDLIISARTSFGITQKQLSEKSGVSQANISKIENGKYIPSIAVLKRIADALNKRLSIVFLDREEEE